MVNIFWMRRDLRLHDNHALYAALKEGQPVVCVFIFDSEILEDLKVEGQVTTDRRLVFIHHYLEKVNAQLEEYGSSIRTFYGKPIDVWHEILNQFKVNAVYFNHDFEPYAVQRDSSTTDLLTKRGITVHTFKDQVVFEKSEVVKDDGSPYKVFTPYSRKWKARLEKEGLAAYPSEDHLDAMAELKRNPVIPLSEMGFASADFEFPKAKVDGDMLSTYGGKRDFPSLQATSRLGVHLRFGTISIRKLVKYALQSDAPVYLNELIWREFYMMVLWYFPHVVDRAFNAKYDHIPWINDEREFKLWCEGKTGYPIVDAGMRQLAETGYMHNRVRMVTASFLTKHLLIDWRWGEAWFARHLLDFELASNNGGWQWAAGTGCDAAPYFRVFNPTSQMKKFDKDKDYIKRWVPEYGTVDYPEPMVEHKFARQRALDTYKKALG